LRSRLGVHPSCSQRLVVTIACSKADKEGAGRKIDIARVVAGPLFRPIDRHGRISASRLSGEVVSLIVRERLAAAGFDPTGYSGHSLRAGFATSAAMAGVSSVTIRRQTGHASDTMLARYVRDGYLFRDNAVGALL
jgi:integrase